MFGRMAGKTGQRLAAFGRPAIAMAIAIAAVSAADRKAQDWRDYGGGPDNSKFSPLKQIDKSNVSKLQVAWTYPYGETLFNPIVVRGFVYAKGRNRLPDRARRGHRQGDLDPRRPRRHDHGAA